MTGRIAYLTSAGGGGQCEGVFVMDADGSHLRRVTGPHLAVLHAEWSPDGQQIAFDGECSPVRIDICVINADGSGIRAVVSGSGTYWPTWSPDGKRLAYSKPVDAGHADIYSVNLDGSDERRVTSAAGNATEPSWSSDGASIAFVSEKDGTRQIATVSARGGTAVIIAPAGTVNDAPSWSRDGKRIAFSSDRTGKPESAYDARARKFPGSEGLPVRGAEDIFTMSADGKNVVRLTSDPSANYSPVWSPDDQHIAFTSDRDPHYALYVMATDGSGQKRLSSVSQDAGSPSWNS